jgi:putative acetyltransferase
MPLVTLDSADPRALALMDAQHCELIALYGGDEGSTEAFDPESLVGGVLLGWEEAGELLLIGGLKPWHDAQGSAEVKRMYAVPGARGRGLSRLILAGLIAWARAHGVRRLMLETGDRQPEAIGLYSTSGFRRIPNFGYYVGLDASLCFELALNEPVAP